MTTGVKSVAMMVPRTHARRAHTASAAKAILALRLKWYRENMFVFLERHSHTIIITVLCALPFAFELETAIGIARAVATPVMTVAGPAGAYLHDVVAIAILHLVFISWIAVQGKAVTGEPLTTYLASLPITVRDRRFVDAWMIVYANHLTWLTVVFPLFLAPYSTLSPAEIALFGLRTAALAIITVGMQMLWLYGKRRYLAVFLLLDAILIASKALAPGPAAIGCTVAFALSCVGAFIALPHLAAAHEPRLSRIRSGARNRGLPRRQRPPLLIEPVLTMYRRVLFSERLNGTILRLAASTAIAIAGTVFVIRSASNGDGGAVNYLIVLAGWLTFFCSGLYGPLYDARRPLEPYLRTLPIRKYTWVFIDATLISLLAAALSLPAIVYLLREQCLSLFQGAVITVLEFPLLLALYPIRNRMPRQSSVAAIAVSIVWILSMLAFVAKARC
ncbi:MAG: hypothetical protein JWM26_537 [Betaproteobacteria bacterium]|nr:hypothetical protein [Betaproteobacteria bacterium]